VIRLSTKGRYGVRLMLDLALHFGKGLVSLRDVAQRQEISEKYLWQLIAPLKHAGLINAARGANGGYALTRPPKQINLKDIVSVLEGPVCLLDCVNNPSACKRSALCIARDVWQETSRKILKILSTVTLENMVHKQKNKIKNWNQKSRKYY